MRMVYLCICFYVCRVWCSRTAIILLSTFKATLFGVFCEFGCFSMLFIIFLPKLFSKIFRIIVWNWRKSFLGFRKSAAYSPANFSLIGIVEMEISKKCVEWNEKATNNIGSSKNRRNRENFFQIMKNDWLRHLRIAYNLRLTTLKGKIKFQSKLRIMQIASSQNQNEELLMIAGETGFLFCVVWVWMSMCSSPFR